MSSNIEINAPALLVVAAEQATQALQEGNIAEAQSILDEIHTVSHQLVAWLNRLAQAGLNVPSRLTWTEFVHREKKRASNAF